MNFLYDFTATQPTLDSKFHSDRKTFGLSIWEFSISGKPVITYKPGFLKRIKSTIKWILKKHYTYAEAHIMNLGKKEIYYSSKRQLEKILTNSLLCEKAYGISNSKIAINL